MDECQTFLENLSADEESTLTGGGYYGYGYGDDDDDDDGGHGKKRGKKRGKGHGKGYGHGYGYKGYKGDDDDD